MSRRPMHAEFGFTTGLYAPPAKPRALWRTLLISALLMLIPAVGPGVSAVYVDRRDDPERFDFGRALTTALIQLIAFAAVAAILWLIVAVLLGVRIQFSR